MHSLYRSDPHTWNAQNVDMWHQVVKNRTSVRSRWFTTEAVLYKFVIPGKLSDNSHSNTRGKQRMELSSGVLRKDAQVAQLASDLLLPQTCRYTSSLFRFYQRSNKNNDTWWMILVFLIFINSLEKEISLKGVICTNDVQMIISCC